MHSVPKKKKKRGLSKLLLLCLCSVLLAGAAVGYMLLQQPPQVPAATRTDGELYVYPESEVRVISVTPGTGEAWTLLLGEDGSRVLAEAEDWPLDDFTVERLLMAASTLTYEAVLAENAADYAGHMAEYGLEPPQATVEIAYADGNRVRLYIGTVVEAADVPFAYMMAEGDPRLFKLDKGTAEVLMTERSMLRSITQPVLHKARMNRITLSGEGGDVKASWALNGQITDTDAAARWELVTPVRYPAEAEEIANLRTNLSNIRFGSYIGEATPENRTLYGFDRPRFVIEISQAPGVINTVDENGAAYPVMWPASVWTLTVGAAKNEFVDYVMVEDAIYTSSHFTLGVFMELEPLNTVSRYPVTVATVNLAALDVQTPAGTDRYVVTRTEQVGENNEIVTDAEGNIQWDVAVTRNGEAISWEAFEAAYVRLETVRVSGVLPEGWQPQQAPHTVYTLHTTMGEAYTIALTQFDAMHDAVVVNGNALFYLIRNGMVFTLEAE